MQHFLVVLKSKNHKIEWWSTFTFMYQRLKINISFSITVSWWITPSFATGIHIDYYMLTSAYTRILWEYIDCWKSAYRSNRKLPRAIQVGGFFAVSLFHSQCKAISQNEILNPLTMRKPLTSTENFHSWQNKESLLRSIHVM